MKMYLKNFKGLLIPLALSATLFTGCGNSTASETNTQTATTEKEVESTVTETSIIEETSTVSETVAENEEETKANQLLADLTGTYEELWPVVLDEQYANIWLEDSANLVGEDNAQAAVDKLSSMVTAEIYGEEAVETYAANPDSMAYDCSFTQNLSEITFDGNIISGVDNSGNSLFTHEYHYIGMEEIRGLYEYQTDDADAGEFTYFFIAPDTSDTTYHIEFRYGADKDALESYDSGEYAYWLASGISTECNETMINNCIDLFCTENLSGN